MRIGELARKTDVSVRALRYYEQQDLLVPERSPSGQRLYPSGAVERVDLIQRLYAAGLTSKAILGLLPCAVSGTSTPDSRRRLAEERERLDARIVALVETRDRLDAIITAASTCDAAGPA